MPPSSQQFAWWPQPQQGQRHPLTPLAVTALKQEEAATGRAKGSAYSPTKRTPTKAAVPASPQQQQQDEPLTNLTQKQQEQPATTTAPEGNGTKQSSSGSDAAVGSPTTGLGPLDFVLEAVIGVGAYGKVFKATSKHTGRPFALKVIDKARLRTGKPTIAMLVKEATLLRMVDHPFVLKLHATFQTQDKVFFLTDLLSGGDCFRHEQLRGFQEAEVRHLAAQAVLALEYLHSKGILYRDMKPENLSLDAAGNLVLIDMGHGIQAATATDLAGTPEYMAPEQIYQQPHDHAVDYWGLGITLYELMARRHPFGKATAQHILAVEPAFDARGGFRQPLSRACVDFLSGLLRKDPRQRLADPRQIRAHPWFRGLDWAALEKKLIAPPYRPSGSLWQNFDPEFLAMPPVLDASEAGPHIPGFSYEPPAAIAAVRGTAPVVVAPNNNTGTTGTTGTTGSTGNSNTNTTADASANANTGSSEVNQTSRPATPASAGGMAQPPPSSSSAAGVAPSGGGQPYPGAAAPHLHHYHPHHSHHGHGHHGHHDHWRRVPNTTSSAPAPVAAPASQQQPNQQPNSRIVTMTA